MQDYYTPKGKHLTLSDRRNIERWLHEGCSNREVARRLDKAPQTIHNEVKRGLILQQVRQSRFKKVYSADRAQMAYEENRKRSVKAVQLDKQTRVFFFQFFRQFQTELLILLQSDMRYIIHYSFKDYLKVLVNNYFLNEVRPSIEPYWQSYVSAGLADVLFTWILSGAKESDQEMANIIYKVARMS
ncbi:helix-turn-helix domain-containing protein [Streptococcus hyointestinalis]|uniref:helix-turn-helix domain-containing protein n=2 Tax=Streptococcus TaxID=1301 RepID=UPI0035129663